MLGVGTQRGRVKMIDCSSGKVSRGVGLRVDCPIKILLPLSAPAISLSC